MHIAISISKTHFCNTIAVLYEDRVSLPEKDFNKIITNTINTYLCSMKRLHHKERRVIVLFTLIFAYTFSVWAESEPISIPRDSVPENHLAWLGLCGPVAEMTEYDYSHYGKKICRFDKHGRLIEYIEYNQPFSDHGGCVFGLVAHYRYAYTEEGKMIFEETYNVDYNTVDEFADITLELFPKQSLEENLMEQAMVEYGDSTYCFGEWTSSGNVQHYKGVRYDSYGNWLEQVEANLDTSTNAQVYVREIKYYKDIDLLNLPVGTKSVTNEWMADDRSWRNRYDFDKDGNLTSFRSWVGEKSKADSWEHLFEWSAENDEGLGSDYIVADDGKESKDVKRKIDYWTVPIGELTILPDDINEKNGFGLIFNYMGYVFEGDLYPLHNGLWVVLNYWCLDEMDGIYLDEEDENSEPVPASTRYKNPFAGMRYPIIKTDSVSFSTRNYGNQTINLYQSSDGKKVRSRLKVQCSLDVLDADPETRRLFVKTNPSDDCWGEPQTEEEKEWIHPFVAVKGWIDEEWVCANLLTTCP